MTNTHDEKPFYTPPELAALLDVSQRTLCRWHAMRKGPARSKCGSFIAYNKQAVRDWMQSNETAPTRH